MKFHIYHLIDPETKEVKYVGMTNNPQRRYWQHIKNLDRRMTEKRAWLEGLFSRSLLPEIEIVDTADNEVEGRNLEQQHVTMNKSTILNIHNPGKGMKSFKRYPKSQ